MRTVRFSAIFGAVLGVGIALVLLSLAEIKQDPVIWIVMASLCPIFVLGFSVKNTILFYVIAIAGNGVFYGVSAGIIGLVFALFQRLTARSRNP